MTQDRLPNLRPSHNGVRSAIRFSPAVQFGAADFSAAAGGVVAPLLLLGLGHDGRDFQAVPLAVNGDEREIRRGDVLRRVGDIVLDENFYSSFHRGVKYTIH